MVTTRSQRRLEVERQTDKNQLPADQSAAAPPELLSTPASAPGQNLLETTPCLLLPGPHEYDDNATVLSVATGKSTSVRASFAATMRGHVAIGSSSGGWLVTADDRGALRMANPLTGAHADLPPISTLPFLRSAAGADDDDAGWFILDVQPFLHTRFRGAPPPPEHTAVWPAARTYTLKASQMRQVIYRKVVLSPSPSPSPPTAAAMLLTDRSMSPPVTTTLPATRT